MENKNEFYYTDDTNSQEEIVIENRVKEARKMKKSKSIIFIMGILFAIIAGIMLHISFYELLPSSKRYNKKLELKLQKF